MDTSRSDEKSTARRKGWIVFALLAVLTAIEFAVSIGLAGPLPYLAVIALAKAALIVVYFMHLGDLGAVWRRDAAEEVAE